MKIAVAGGTGTVGHHVTEEVRASGHEPVVLARGVGVDAMTGAGLAEALEGVNALIDVMSVQTMSDEHSREFFGTTTRKLLAAEAAAGVTHHVALSIVGVDQAPFSYYAGKVLQEHLVHDGAVPWSILRATQFHEFAEQMHKQLVRRPLGVIPVMRTQPVAAREVAERLVELAVGEPQGRTHDLAGPREEHLIDMVRRFARAQGLPARMIEIPVPGPYGRAMRDGTLLPGPGFHHGKQSFAEWIAALPAPSKGARSRG